MFTEPKIVSTADITVRAYVTFYLKGKRYREYNGKRLKLDINPNHFKQLKDRDRLLVQLQFEFKKALHAGWCDSRNEVKRIILMDAMDEVLRDKLNSSYSKTYKRDLAKLHEQFLSYFDDKFMKQEANRVDILSIEGFLSQFKSSGRHYMNKRTTLSVFFSEMLRRGYIEKNIVTKTTRQKTKAVLHKTYSTGELKDVLAFMKDSYPNLYLCCLITYGCFLRPHQEIRLLSRRNFNEDFSEIKLSGFENKSGRIRKVFVPEYVISELKDRLLTNNNTNVNIFSLSEEFVFNECYFKTMWSKAKAKMLQQGIIQPLQTIYSFRHTAVVNVYRKTKDLYLLQQLLQHSDMVVTLNYLRGLGEITFDDLKSAMPEI